MVFNYIPSGENIDENDMSVTMNNTSVTLSVGGSYSELKTSDVTSIKYKGVEIKSSVSNLSVITSSISGGLTPDQITHTAGTYTVTYTVSFVYSGKSISKTVNQTVTVE